MADSDEATILETSPFVVALVFVLFLVATIGFEKILELIRWLIIRFGGKEGLLTALEKMKTEMMLLGFASLLLIVCQDSISSYCISASYGAKTWLDHAKPCACCLTRTRGVTPCYIASRGCVSEPYLEQCCSEKFNGATRKECDSLFDTDPDFRNVSLARNYKVNVLTGDINLGASRRRLLSSGNVWEEGKPSRTILQTRSRLQSRASRRRLDEDNNSTENPFADDNYVVDCFGRYAVGADSCNYALDRKPVLSQAALHDIHLLIFETAVAHIVVSMGVILLASWRLHSWKKRRRAEKHHLHMVQNEVDEYWRSMDAFKQAHALENAGNPSSISLDAGLKNEPELAVMMEFERKQPWQGRPFHLKGFRAWLKELFWCIVRQFGLHQVTSQEFSLMESSFILSHGIRSREGSGFAFLPYVRRAMEEDFSKIVGLSITIWVFIILFLLLSSAIGWCIWLFTIISGVVLAVVNTKLVWIVRYAARGGNVNKLNPNIFWLRRPYLLLPVLEIVLFFASWTFANTVFFASQFGPSSCFFSSQGIQNIPIPWWVFVTVNAIYLFSLGLVTLPLYSVAVQMGGDFKCSMLSSNPEEAASIASEADQIQSIRKRQAAKSQGFKRLISRYIPMQRHDKSWKFGSNSVHSERTVSKGISVSGDSSEK